MSRCARHFAFLATPLVALVAGAWGLFAAESKPLAKGDPVKGKAIFSKNCVVCHNPDGSGGKKLTPNGNPSRDFRDSKFWASKTDEELKVSINKGIAKSGMIAWKGILKPQEIEDVLAYIHTFNTGDKKK